MRHRALTGALVLTIGLSAACARAASPEDPPEVLLHAIEAAQEDYRLPEYYALARRFLTRHPQHPAKDAVRIELALQLIAENLQSPASAEAQEARTLLVAQEKEAKRESDRFDAALLLLKFGAHSTPAQVEAAADQVLARYPKVEGVTEVQIWAIARLLELDAVAAAAGRAARTLDQVDAETRTDYLRLIARAKLRGQPAPLTDLEKAQLKLAGKKLVVLDFWASWCRPCIEAQPALQSFQAAHPQVWIVGINLDDDPADAKNHPSPFPQLAGKASGVDERFGVTQLPTYVILDGAGRIVETELEGEGLFRHLLELLRDGEAEGRKPPHQSQKR